jgi:hypothetical protein
MKAIKSGNTACSGGENPTSPETGHVRGDESHQVREQDMFLQKKANKSGNRTCSCG